MMKKTEVTLTTKSEAAQDALCPSCGRFVGPYATCPYCGTHLQGRLPLRVVKIAAILLATVGLVALWWAARQLEIPLLTVAEAQGTMNMAYVRLQGHISRSLSYDPEGGYLGFWVDDGTGEVRVSAYRDVTAELLASHRVPGLGDAVEVAGTLRIREDFVSLTLNVPEHLTIQRPEPVSVEIGALTQLDEGLRVRVSGEVQELFSPYEGLTLITVHDASGELSVAVDETLTALTGALPEIVEGQGIVVTGTVTLYRDRPQLTPSTVQDIMLSASPLTESAPAETRALSALSAADEGGWFQVTGRVVALAGFQGGVKATLDDGTAQVLLLLWQSIYDELPQPTALDVGAELEVKGKLQVYEGELELIPEQASDVRMLVAAPEFPWVEVAELSEADVGRIVRLRGVLGEPVGFSTGVKAPLDDGAGIITVLLWSNVAEAVTPAPSAGLLLEIVGEVASYQGELEIIPRSAHDWRAGE
ncbi:MAG TPA: hypothetical protein G4N98_08690 [Thermoflexia bacterium]|nr:hypothetical protein [Thermoflexia bacterium]